MSSEQAYQVDPEQLRGHANRLGTHADQLSSIGTALPDQLGESSLGMLAHFMAAGIGLAMTETSDAFAHASSTLDKVSDGLRRAADQYESSDEEHAAGVTGIGAAIEEGGSR